MAHSSPFNSKSAPSDSAERASSSNTKPAPSGTAERALVARPTTIEAGKLTWDYFERGVETEIKADRTPVTIADKDAEELIRNRIRHHFPDDGFLGEEFGDEPSRTGFRWIIDPIDATANFIRGVPLFGNLVGLEYEGEMVAGFVYQPAFKQLYRAERGGGAFRDDKPIRVSDIQSFAEAHLQYSSILFADKMGVAEPFLAFQRQFARTRGFGDYYGFLLIADGCAEIMIDPVVAPWDVAALKPIVEEAGGVFTDWFGVPTIYGQGAVAGNPTFHHAFIDCVHSFPSANDAPSNS